MSNDIPESSDGGGCFPVSQTPLSVKQWAKVVQEDENANKYYE